MKFPTAFYFSDETRGSDPLEQSRILPQDTGIIYRHYNFAGRFNLAARLSKSCRKRQIPLFIAKTPGLAAAIGAAGCHLPENFIPMIPAIRRRFPQLYVSAACHSEIAVKAAVQAGADLLFLSSIFPTKSHPGEKVLGLLSGARLARSTALPVFALGGISPQRLNAISAAGFAGFGAISYFEN
ncbi:MAG: thiamine phosphate synthase [Sneathiella sp.]